MSDEVLLEIRKLNAYYVVNRTPIRVLRNVSLKLRSGEKLVIVGESGSGKSTLASLIARLEPENLVIESGSALYRFNGQFIDLLRADERLLYRIRGKEISMIFQNPSTSLNPVYTIGYQVGEALRLERVDRSRLRVKVEGLLKSVKLPDPIRIIRTYPHQLSGGQKQRAVIAIAISRAPKLIIADEPTSSLDVSVQVEILELLKDINKRGSSIMMITHDIGVAHDFADLIVVMYGGMIAEIGRPGEVVNEPIHPYTKYLISSIPRGPKLSLELLGADFYEVPRVVPAEGCPFSLACRYARDTCRTVEPPLVRLGGRYVACHEVGGGSHESTD